MADTKSRDPKILTKPAHIGSSVRIRDNQRRSRARRKEYIQDLEERVRRFETVGVQATIEVQAAGRKVGAENFLLRSLLREHGVADNDVEEYLKSHLTGPGLSNRPLLTSQGLLGIPRNKDQPVFGYQSYADMDDGLPHEYESEFVGVDSLSPNAIFEDFRVRGTMLAAGEQPMMTDSSTLAKSSEVKQPDGRQGTGQVTSCEAAARIIMTMRGIPDVGSVRSELGCGPEDTCTVKNMDLFEILDK